MGVFMKYGVSTIFNVSHMRLYVSFIALTYNSVGDASHADPSLSERGSSGKLRAPMRAHRARVGRVEPGDATMQTKDSAGLESPASTRAEPTTTSALDWDAIQRALQNQRGRVA